MSAIFRRQTCISGCSWLRPFLKPALQKRGSCVLSSSTSASKPKKRKETSRLPLGLVTAVKSIWRFFMADRIRSLMFNIDTQICPSRVTVGKSSLLLALDLGDAEHLIISPIHTTFINYGVSCSASCHLPGETGISAEYAVNRAKKTPPVQIGRGSIRCRNGSRGFGRSRCNFFT